MVVLVIAVLYHLRDELDCQYNANNTGDDILYIEVCDGGWLIVAVIILDLHRQRSSQINTPSCFCVYYTREDMTGLSTASRLHVVSAS